MFVYKDIGRKHNLRELTHAGVNFCVSLLTQRDLSHACVKTKSNFFTLALVN